MNEIRNILLIGRTGGGKSTLGNVLINKNDDFEEVFRESDGSISATKDVKEAIAEIDLNRDGSEKVKYRIIDTIGIGDTKLTPQGVLNRLAEMAGRVKEEGLNHILFVTKGRFAKEEIEAYDLLTSIIFDSEVLRYTTIVRTSFPRFENNDRCEDDRAALRRENADLAHILNSVNIMYVDNPSPEDYGEMAKTRRESSRKRLLTYLAVRRHGNYRPSNIDTLDERVENYRTNEQLLKEKMKELEKARKEQEEEFRKKITDLKEEQTRELRENRIKFEEDIRKTKVEGEENLRKTKTELEDKRRRDMEDLENRNRQQINNLQESHRREAESIRAAGERQMQTIQDQMKRSQEETDRLRQELSERNNSSNAELVSLLAQVRIDDQEREEKRDQERREFEERMFEESQAREERQREEVRELREEIQQQERTRMVNDLMFGHNPYWRPPYL